MEYVGKHIGIAITSLFVLLFVILAVSTIATNLGHTHFISQGETVEGSRVCIPSTCSGAKTEHRHCVSKNRPGHFISKSIAKKNGVVRDVVKADRALEHNCHRVGFNIDAHLGITNYTDGSPTTKTGVSDHKRDGRSSLAWQEE